MIDIALAKKLPTMKSEPKNKDPLAPWNNPLYKDNPLAPHNGDNPLKALE
jgi:hypothetical protein